MSQQPSNLISSDVNLSETISMVAQELAGLSTRLHEVLQGVMRIELENAQYKQAAIASNSSQSTEGFFSDIKDVLKTMLNVSQGLTVDPKVKLQAEATTQIESNKSLKGTGRIF